MSALSPPCKALIRADTVDIECPATLIGSVSLHGHFTPLVHDWEHQNLLDGIILSGALVIASRGEELFAKRVDFHFWEGD